MILQIAVGFLIFSSYPDFSVGQTKNNASKPAIKTFTARIEAVNNPIKSQSQKSLPQPFKKLTKTSPANKMKSLEKLTEGKNPLEIHNKALGFLKNNQREEALLLLKKNLYQNFFFPSYLVLSYLEIPIFFTPFLWHIGFIFFSLICFFLFLLSFNEPNSSYPKLLFLFLALGLILSFSEFFLLKQRVSSFQEMDLRLAPFATAPIKTSLSPNSDLIILKQKGDWLVVQSQDKQTGWLEKQKVFRIF